MSGVNRERSFYAGLAIVGLSLMLYGVHGLTGHTLSLFDLLFHAMPFTLGGLLMVPKLFPGIFAAVMATLQRIFGKPPVAMP